MALLHQPKLKTLARVQASRGGQHKASSGAASPGRLARRRRVKARVPHEGARDASHDYQDQAGASQRSVLVSSLVQRGQAQARVSSKGNHFGATRPRLAKWQDGGHRGAQAGVIVRVFGRRGPTLVRISVLDVPLQIGQFLAPFLLNIREEARGLLL